MVGYTEDQSLWPEHLRDDAPFQTCSKCGRKTWNKPSFGLCCLMPQPNGTVCNGMFTILNKQ